MGPRQCLWTALLYAYVLYCTPCARAGRVPEASLRGALESLVAAARRRRRDRLGVSAAADQRALAGSSDPCGSSELKPMNSRAPTWGSRSHPHPLVHARAPIPLICAVDIHHCTRLCTSFIVSYCWAARWGIKAISRTLVLCLMCVSDSHSHAHTRTCHLLDFCNL